jgi:hypothetical protein
VFFKPATIHHDEQSRIECALRSRLVDHTFL